MGEAMGPMRGPVPVGEPGPGGPGPGAGPVPVRMPVGGPMRIPIGGAEPGGPGPAGPEYGAPAGEDYGAGPVPGGRPVPGGGPVPGRPGGGPGPAAGPVRVMGPVTGMGDNRKPPALGEGPESGHGDSADGQTKYGVRDTLKLVASAVRLVWVAGRKEFIWILAMDVVQALAVFFVIVQLQRVITDLLRSNTGGSSSMLALNLGMFAGANLLAVIAQAVISNWRPLLSERTAMFVCGEVIKVASLAELGDFDDSGFHDRLQRAAASAATRPSMMVQSLVMIVQESIAILSIWIAMVTIAPYIALALLLVIVPIWISGVRGGEHFFGFITRITHTDRGRSYLFGLLTSREAAKEIRAFNIAEYLSKRWRSSMGERVEALAETMRKRMRSTLVGSIASNAVMAAAAAALIGLNQFGYLTLPQTATVAGVLLMFSQRLLRSVAMANDFFESAPLVRDLNEFLELEPTLIRNREGIRFDGDFERIDVEDLSYTYFGSERPALDGVSLSFKAGEVVALVGENGSGKTTLAKLLGGLYEPAAGAIRIDGTDLREIDTISWRDHVAVLFQDFIRYALPAGENIHVGSVTREPVLDDIREAAREAGADEFLSALPDGYKTILSPQFNRGQDLSLGQWQRVALARAFFRNAPLVILDEPTASLDARAERALYESVRDLYANRTVLMISHRFATVRTADRIIVLRDGGIVEQGTHDQLMAADGLYAELYSIQASAFIEADEEEAENALDATPRG